MMRRTIAWWLAAVATSAGCGGEAPDADTTLSVEAEADAALARVVARLAAEVPCEGIDRPSLLCQVPWSDLGQGRGSWSSGAREVLTGLQFGVRPSRPVPRGILETFDLVVGVIGDGGAAVLPVAPPDAVARDALRPVRMAWFGTVLPDMIEPPPYRHAPGLPAAVLDTLEPSSLVLEPLAPGEHGWVGEDAVWYAVPPGPHGVRQVRVAPHGEGVRVIVLFETEPADAAP